MFTVDNMISLYGLLFALIAIVGIIDISEYFEEMGENNNE